MMNIHELPSQKVFKSIVHAVFFNIELIYNLLGTNTRVICPTVCDEEKKFYDINTWTGSRKETF
jgi:hypothetical protein